MSDSNFCFTHPIRAGGCYIHPSSNHQSPSKHRYLFIRTAVWRSAETRWCWLFFDVDSAVPPLVGPHYACWTNESSYDCNGAWNYRSSTACNQRARHERPTFRSKRPSLKSEHAINAKAAPAATFESVSVDARTAAHPAKQFSSSDDARLSIGPGCRLGNVYGSNPSTSSSAAPIARKWYRDWWRWRRRQSHDGWGLSK